MGNRPLAHRDVHPGRTGAASSPAAGSLLESVAGCRWMRLNSVPGGLVGCAGTLPSLPVPLLQQWLSSALCHIGRESALCVRRKPAFSTFIPECTGPPNPGWTMHLSLTRCTEKPAGTHYRWTAYVKKGHKRSSYLKNCIVTFNLGALESIGASIQTNCRCPHL